MFFRRKENNKGQLNTDEYKVFDLIKKKYETLASLTANTSTATQDVNFAVFLERYRNAESLPSNLRRFLIEELNYIDELLVVVREKLASSKKTTKAYQEITEKLIAKHSHYPKVNLGSGVPDEYCHLLGAIRKFSNSFTGGIEKVGRLVKDRELKTVYHHFEYSYHLLFVDSREGYPKIFHTSLSKSHGMKKLDDIQKVWQPVYKLMFTVLMELTRFMNGIYKKEQIKGNLLFYMENKTIIFSEWRESLLLQIDKLMDNFRLKGLI